MPQDQQQWVIMALSFGLVALVFAQRLIRKRKAPSQRTERLWMFPAFYTAAVFLLFGVHAPAEAVWFPILVAFFGGAGLGWYRGKFMAIQVDPQTLDVKQRGTTLVMGLVLLLLVLRYVARFHADVLPRLSPSMVINVTDVLLCLGLGFVVAQGVELFQRARALAGQAKGKA